MMMSNYGIQFKQVFQLKMEFCIQKKNQNKSQPIFTIKCVKLMKKYAKR